MSLRKLLFLIALFAIAIVSVALIWNYFQTPPLSESRVISNAQTIANAQISNTKKTERNSKLQSQTDSLLYLFDKMPSVLIYLTDEPIIKGGNNVEHGVAYTECGQNKTPTIYIKKIFYDQGNQKQITNILKHELTHAWQCKRGGMRGHDTEFRKKFTEAGGFGN